MIIILVALYVIIDRPSECSMEFVACFPTKLKRQKVLNPVMSVPMSFVNHSPFTRNYTIRYGRCLLAGGIPYTILRGTRKN